MIQWWVSVGWYVSASDKEIPDVGARTFPRTQFSPDTKSNAGEREGKGNRKCIALSGEILYYSPCSPDLPGLWETYERLMLVGRASSKALEYSDLGIVVLFDIPCLISCFHI